MTIKMKDMLALPVKRTAGGIMPFLKDGNDEVMFVGSSYHVDLCVTAINAYDANQEEIECLLKSIINLTNYGDEKLKKNVEQQQEIAELKAMVNALIEKANPALDDMVVLFSEQRPSHSDGSFSVDGQSCHDLQFAIESTPTQCLVSVKADAIDSVKAVVAAELNEIFDEEMLTNMESKGVIACKDGFILSIVATVELEIEEHTNKLRDQKS